MDQGVLPFWTENVRAVPKAAVYSALFAPLMKGSRTHVKRQELAVVGRYRLIYSGERLDQSDLDVFLWMLHRNRKSRAEKPITFSANALIRDLGLAKSKGNREWLIQALTRLQACSVEVKYEAKAYSGALVSSLIRNEDSGEYTAVLNARLAELMDPGEFGGYAQVHFEQRRKLKGRGLARWLHAFAAGASHKPLTYRLDALHDLAGGGYSRLRDFRARLDAAAEEVRAAGCPLELSWSQEGDSVTLQIIRPTP
jgi:hypothetical protein